MGDVLSYSWAELGISRQGRGADIAHSSHRRSVYFRLLHVIAIALGRGIRHTNNNNENY